MVLNPSDYLTSQGWGGPGKGLTASSRAKPITVLQKKNNFGVGKDRDTSYPWWDDVFSTVLNKIGEPRGGVQQAGKRAENLVRLYSISLSILTLRAMLAERVIYDLKK